MREKWEEAFDQIVGEVAILIFGQPNETQRNIVRAFFLAVKIDDLLRELQGIE